MDRKIPFKDLPNSQWRQWVQESRRHPEDLQLRSFLLKGLWDIQQFREVLDLLPPLLDENLELGLKWRAQVLFRLAFAGSSYVKRLIPVVLSYSHYLKEPETNALLQLLNDLVQSREDKTLCQYHELVLSISKEAKQSLQSLQIPLSPRLFLSPEIAARLGPGPCEEIYTLLKQCGSSAANYYAPGGQYLLLALGGFFSEVPSQERKSMPEEVSFQLDLITAFRSLKKISQQLKPHQQYLAETPSAQLFLANHIHHFVQELKTGANQLQDKRQDKIQDKEAAKALAEVCEYLTGLFEFISKKTGVLPLLLDLAFLETHLLYFEEAKVKLNISLLTALLEKAETLSKKRLPPEYLSELAPVKIKIEELFVKHCLQKSDLKNLSRFLTPKKKNEIKDLCLDHIDQMIKECLAVGPHVNFLDKVEFCLQVLANFKPQKQRQKILSTITKALHERKGR
jgi:hypothetical protein